MISIQNYQKIEAIEELLDDYDLVIASLDADIALSALRIQFAESKMKTRKLANENIKSYLRIKYFKEAIHFNDLKKLIYQHYQEGLREKLKNVQRGEE